MRGYDSTLERVKDKKTVQYKYNVGDSWYIVTECTSDFQVDDMRGQEIRLWKAYENGDTNKMPVVIKGVWLDNGDETEGNIRTLKDMIDDEMSKRHFPTLADNDLPRNSDNGLVSVPPGIADKATKQSSSCTNTRVGSIRSESIGSHNCIHQPPKSTTRPQAIFVVGENARSLEGVRPRCEYRIELKEVYTPYFNLKRLKTMFEALRDTIIVLRTVCPIGFTHRDISVAHVLWDEKSKCATLTDLELVGYADTMTSRIGTPGFMAVEVYVGLNTQKSKLPAVYRYNPIHDLESVWRLAVWTLFNRVPKSEVESRDEMMKLDRDEMMILYRDEMMKLYRQESTYGYLFHTRCWRPDMRSSVFLNPDSFRDLASQLPELFSSAINHVDIFASCLRTHYGAAELDIATLHENKFETLYQDLVDVVTALLSLIPHEPELQTVNEALRVMTR